MEFIFILAGVGIIWAVLLVWVLAIKGRAFPPYQAPICTGDCEQGRYCTCGPTEECVKLNPNWPFPKERP